MQKKIALAAVAALTLAGVAQAQTVVYSDSFSRTTGLGDPTGGTGDSDWGINDNALGGTLSATYAVGPERGGGANQVVDGSVGTTIEGGAFLDLDASGVAPLGFSVALDFDRFASISDGGDGNGFIAIGLGVDAGTTDASIGGGLFAVNNADVAYLFQQSANGLTGNTQLHVDGALVTDGLIDYGDPLATHSLLLEVTPQSPGLYGDADLIDIAISVDGGTAVTSTVNGGANFGSFAVSSNGFVFRGIDNLVVTAVDPIPEPASLALLGLGGLGLVRRRR